jgi:hypothetical protein
VELCLLFSESESAAFDVDGIISLITYESDPTVSSTPTATAEDSTPSYFRGI